MCKRLRILLCMLLVWSGVAYSDPLLDEMVQVANVVFSGNGTEDMVEWERFTMQIMPEVEPVDIAALFRPESTVAQEQRNQAKFLFLKSQGIATLERGGKTMTEFLQSRGFTMSLYDHHYNPALMFTKDNEPSRRFDFVRRDGKLKLAKVTLEKP